MKVSNLQDASYHQRCVCQICTCGKHHCPHSHVSYPLGQSSSYQTDYVSHPINVWQKPPPEKAKPYQPYGYINSSNREDFPGHQPKMRQKIVPRVKKQDTNVPFSGNSEYRDRYPNKSVQKEPIKIKDRQFNPSNVPFQGLSTYKGDYNKKNPNPHKKKVQVEPEFPPGYGFYGETTYGKDFSEKPLNPLNSYKPVQKLGEKGPHDLNSIYRQDFQPKKLPEPCPVLELPKYPKSIEQPAQHVIYNKKTKNWQVK